MKYNFLICGLIIFSSCYNDAEEKKIKTYDFIEDEIEFYKKQMIFKVHKYQRQNDTLNQRQMNDSLYYRVLDYYHNTKGLIQVINRYPPQEISFAYDDSLLKARDCGGLYEKIVDTTKMFDTLYLHNVKFEYIKCFIKNSKYYDSMPELKARIESYED